MAKNTLLDVAEALADAVRNGADTAAAVAAVDTETGRLRAIEDLARIEAQMKALAEERDKLKPVATGRGRGRKNTGGNTQ